MNLIEKIIAAHSQKESVKPGDIVDVEIDARIARDFGGANVVKNLMDYGLQIHDASKTYFTFDTNPGGSDQKYAANQHFCRQYARENGIRVFDINEGIGTHNAIDKGLVGPGGTLVSTDSHANILGAIAAFGQGMGDQDIASVWATGKAWFKVPVSVKIVFNGLKPEHISAKDIVLNMLSIFGANTLLGKAVELYGKTVDDLTLDERITISSMATEMGAISLLFPVNDSIVKELQERTGKKYEPFEADENAIYEESYEVDVSKFMPMVARPGHPEDAISIQKLGNIRIDSGFIGSCTNGRIEDLRIAAIILKDKKVAPDVVLKIVPSTDTIWKQALEEGLIEIFKNAGALVSNAGCAGCAAGQVGQNGPGEVTISTGNRNFAGKQGKGKVYLASPAVVAASAITGIITSPFNASEKPVDAAFDSSFNYKPSVKANNRKENPTKVTGRIWIIPLDNIDTDMIFHNRYLTITNIDEMGKYTFDNLEGYEDFAKKAGQGDIVITGKNFGAGSSRQQAVDCFKSLGISCILAESFGAIYERNAINAAFPILTYGSEIIKALNLETGSQVEVDFLSGTIKNLDNNKSAAINPFYEVQHDIYKRSGLLNP